MPKDETIQLKFGAWYWISWSYMLLCTVLLLIIIADVFLGFMNVLDHPTLLFRAGWILPAGIAWGIREINREKAKAFAKWLQEIQEPSSPKEKS